MYFEMICGISPFYDKSVNQFKQKMKEGTYLIQSHMNISPEAIHFISMCL